MTWRRRTRSRKGRPTSSPSATGTPPAPSSTSPARTRSSAAQSCPAVPTCWPRWRSPPAASRRGASPTCSCAAPGSGSWRRAPATRRRLGAAGRRRARCRAGLVAAAALARGGGVAGGRCGGGDRPRPRRRRRLNNLPGSMTKAELQSKHLSELHSLAADAGVPRYRMLSRTELIDELSDGDSGSGSGGGRPRSGGGRGTAFQRRWITLRRRRTAPLFGAARPAPPPTAPPFGRGAAASANDPTASAPTGTGAGASASDPTVSVGSASHAQSRPRHPSPLRPPSRLLRPETRPARNAVAVGASVVAARTRSRSKTFCCRRPPAARQSSARRPGRDARRCFAASPATSPALRRARTRSSC